MSLLFSFLLSIDEQVISSWVVPESLTYGVVAVAYGT